MTAAIGYDATRAVQQTHLDEPDGAIEQLAVAWAVVQFAGSTPTTLKERSALDKAYARVVELAAVLGADEQDLRSALRHRYDRVAGERSVGRTPCRTDAPA